MNDAAIHVRDVPEKIRRAVAKDARERDSSLNDVLGDILAQRMGLTWERSGASFTMSKSKHWLIRVPSVLKHTIDAWADASGNTMTGCVLLAVAQFYGLPEPPAKARRKPPEPVLERRLMEQVRRRAKAGESIRALEREYGVPRESLRRRLQREEARD